MSATSAAVTSWRFAAAAPRPLRPRGSAGRRGRRRPARAPAGPPRDLRAPLERLVRRRPGPRVVERRPRRTTRARRPRRPRRGVREIDDADPSRVSRRASLHHRRGREASAPARATAIGRTARRPPPSGPPPPSRARPAPRPPQRRRGGGTRPPRCRCPARASASCGSKTSRRGATPCSPRRDAPRDLSPAPFETNVRSACEWRGGSLMSQDRPVGARAASRHAGVLAICSNSFKLSGDGAVRHNRPRAPPWPRPSGSVRARAGGARAAQSACTAGAREGISAGSAREKASASTGGSEAGVRSAGARASASTGGCDTRARRRTTARSVSLQISHSPFPQFSEPPRFVFAPRLLLLLLPHPRARVPRPPPEQLRLPPGQVQHRARRVGEHPRVDDER